MADEKEVAISQGETLPPIANNGTNPEHENNVTKPPSAQSQSTEKTNGTSSSPMDVENSNTGIADGKEVALSTNVTTVAATVHKNGTVNNATDKNDEPNDTPAKDITNNETTETTLTSTPRRRIKTRREDDFVYASDKKTENIKEVV